MVRISASRWSEFGGNQDRFDSFLPPKERKNDSDEDLFLLAISFVIRRKCHSLASQQYRALANNQVIIVVVVVAIYLFL